MFDKCAVCGAPKGSSLHAPNHPVNRMNDKVHEFVGVGTTNVEVHAVVELNSVNPQFDALAIGTIPC